METNYENAAHEIIERQDELTKLVVDEYYLRDSSLQPRYGERGRRHVAKDNQYHLAFLSRALACNSPALFKNT